METQSEEVQAAWLDYRAAMAYSSLGRTKLTELVTSGSIPAAKVGTRVLISRAGLDDYLRGNSYADIGQ